MDTDDKRKLARALELSEENNKLLKKLVRAMRWGRFVRVVYWAVIIAASVGAFYYFQPYIDGLQEAYGSLQKSVESVNKLISPGR